MNRFIALALALVVLSMVATPVLAARQMISLGGEKYLQVRGVDKPHGFKNFKSWPGYDSFVHSNCYHVHGEYKKISSSTGREYYNKKVSIPLYCKGATKYIKKAFEGAGPKLGTTAWKFLKVGGVLFTIINEIPSVGGPMYLCKEDAATNSSYCYWTEY